MPKYEPTEIEVTYLNLGKSYVPEQKFDKFKELKFKEIRENREVLEKISLEAYARLSIAWMRFLNDEDFEKFFSQLKKKIVIDFEKVHFNRKIDDDEVNVAKDFLRSMMIEILDVAKVFDENYYRGAIAYFLGNATPLLFSPECYDKEPHEVNYDEEFKKNNRFWLGEIVEYLCSLYKKVVEESLMPFVSSTILNRAKEYFLKFENEAKTTAKRVFENIKNKVR